MNLASKPWMATLASMLAMAAAFSTGCGQPNTKPNLDTACGQDSATCLKMARSWLSQEPPLPVALARQANLDSLIKRWNDDAYAAVHAAHATKLGGVHAAAGNVIKAVESVDAGLAEFEAARRRHPQSRTLRITQILTQSHLPSVFHLRQASLDSLKILQREPQLSPNERQLVDQALLRLEKGD